MLSHREKELAHTSLYPPRRYSGSESDFDLSFSVKYFHDVSYGCMVSCIWTFETLWSWWFCSEFFPVWYTRQKMDKLWIYISMYRNMNRVDLYLQYEDDSDHRGEHHRTHHISPWDDQCISDHHIWKSHGMCLYGYVLETPDDESNAHRKSRYVSHGTLDDAHSPADQWCYTMRTLSAHARNVGVRGI